MATASRELDTGTTIGYKADAGKPRMELLPVLPLTLAAEVFTFGAKKYAESEEAFANNWLQGMRFGRMYGAMQRHLMAFWNGEELDPESGKPHLAHALCCLMMLTEYAHTDRYHQFDDRPLPHFIEELGKQKYEETLRTLAARQEEAA